MLNLIIEDNSLNDAVRGLPLVKECTKCGECKAIDEFYKSKGGKFGVGSLCKECESKRNKDYIAKNNNSRVVEGTKVCTKCGAEKDMSEFPAAKRNKDGLSSWCKSCASKYSKSKNYPRITEGTKICSKCGAEKDIGEFPSAKRNKGGLHEKCRACCAEYNEEKKERSVLVTEGTKICVTCGIEKPVEEFWKLSRSLDGRHYECIECGRKRNNDKNKNTTEEEKEKRRVYKAEYYQNNKDGVIADYKEEHKDEIREKSYEIHKKKMETDVQYRLASNLRRRMLVAVKRGWKSGSAVRDLGCSIEFFKEYLESQFTEGMTWDNWGRGHGCWNIDHIIPLVSFDLTIREQFLEAAHYTNMQPLWFEDNQSKGSKLNWDKENK